MPAEQGTTPRNVPDNAPDLGAARAAAARRGTLFGIPLGELGWFQSFLMATATGFAAFFFATFCGIVACLVLLMSGDHAIDFSLSYRRIGLPAGVVVLLIAYIYFGWQWIRRKVSAR